MQLYYWISLLVIQLNWKSSSETELDKTVADAQLLLKSFKN